MHLNVGETVTRALVFDQEQFDRFAVLSGDDNPIHVDPAFAARSRFGRPVAHGMLLYANLHAAAGQLLPGAPQAEQSLVFSAPTFAGEALQLRLTLLGATADGRIPMATEIVKPDGGFSCQGEAVFQLGLAPDDLAEREPAAPPAAGAAWQGLATGQKATLQRAYTAADLDAYLALLGDTNPLHNDAAFARRLGLRGAPLPGPLLGALFSCLLGTRLPGPGSNWLKQRLVFHHAAYPGDELEANAEIIRLRPEKALVNLRTWVTAGGACVCDGEALVWVGDREAPQEEV